MITNRSLLQIFAATLVFAALAGCTSPTTTTPSTNNWNGDDGKVIPSGFNIVGYYGSWDTIDPASLMFHRLTHIIYAFVSPNADGTLGAMPSPSTLSTLVTKAHANGTKVLVSIGGWMGDSNPTQFYTVGYSSNLSTTFSNNVLAMVNQYNLDGADIDWEDPANGTNGNLDSAAAYTTLMTTLGSTLHGAGKILSAAVSTSNEAISTSALGAMDLVNIMAYDGGWGSTASTGYHSSYGLATAAVGYWTTTSTGSPTGNGHSAVARAKINLGVPFYGRQDNDWSNAITFGTLVSQHSYYAQEDDTGGTFNAANPSYNYNGIPTIEAKTTYAKTNAGGIMIWELSQDATGSNSLLSAIYETVAVAAPTPTPTATPVATP